MEPDPNPSGTPAPAEGNPSPANSPSIMNQNLPPAGQPGSGDPAPTTGPDWLPPEYKDSESLKKFHEGGVPALAKSYLSLEKAFQGKVPGADATPEERQAFWGPLGTPADPAGYSVERPKDLPEGIDWDENFAKTAAAKLHSANLTKDQWEAVLAVDAQRAIDMKANHEKALQDQIAEDTRNLKSKWGGAYDQNVQLSALATKSFAPQDLWDRLEEAGHTSDPLVLELMALVGKAMREGTKIDVPPSMNETLTPEEAGKEQLAMSTDKNHALFEAYHSRKHPDHKKAVDEFARLGQMKRGRTA